MRLLFNFWDSIFNPKSKEHIPFKVKWFFRGESAKYVSKDSIAQLITKLTEAGAKNPERIENMGEMEVIDLISLVDKANKEHLHKGWILSAIDRSNTLNTFYNYNGPEDLEAIRARLDSYSEDYFYWMFDLMFRKTLKAFYDLLHINEELNVKNVKLSDEHFQKAMTILPKTIQHTISGNFLEEYDVSEIINKVYSEIQRKKAEKKLRQERIAHEQKLKAEAERYEKERKRLLKEKEEEKKRIEKHGWDCVDYPRKPWQDKSVINVAVSGISGVGKSTLVNKLLDLPKGQRAKIGVTECTDVVNKATSEPPRYSKYQDGVKVLDMFDCPGCGTEKFPAASYIKDFGLRYFHLVIIVTADRISQADIMLKKELDKFGVPCLVVRNKVDCAVETNQEENDISPEETLKVIRDYFKGQGISDPILTSAKNKSYEWNVLVNEFYRSIKRMCGNAEYVDNDLDKTCDMCFASWMDTTFQDCGHRSICTKCARYFNQINNCYRCGCSIKNIKYD